MHPEGCRFVVSIVIENCIQRNDQLTRLARPEITAARLIIEPWEHLVAKHYFISCVGTMTSSSMQMFHSLSNNYRRMGNKIKQLIDTRKVASRDTQKINLLSDFRIDFMFFPPFDGSTIEKYLNQHQAPTKHDEFTKGLQPSAANKPTTRLERMKSVTNRKLCNIHHRHHHALLNYTVKFVKMVRNRKFLSFIALTRFVYEVCMLTV